MFRVVATGTLALLALAGPAIARQDQPRNPAMRPPVGGSVNALNMPPKPAAVIFNANTNVKPAIDAAIARCAPDRRRVLVIWGDNASRWALRVEEQLRVTGTAWMLRNDYEVIAADIADSNTGPLNLAIAQAYGAKPVPGHNMMPYLTVIETFGEKAGKAVNNSSSDVWMREGSQRSNGEYFALRVQDYLVANRAEQPKAPEVRAAAMAKAKERNCKVFINFNDLEDPWSTRFTWWLRTPAIAEIMGKHFVVTTIDLIRMPEAAAEFSTLGGDKSDSAPWYVLLDPEGKQVAPDKEKGETDLGFPTGDEIGAFVKMVRRVDPTITEAEGATIAKSLEPPAPPTPPAPKQTAPTPTAPAAPPADKKN